ncbi:MAG: glycosyltransferase [Methanobacteriota archaeon]|nr:MAG: glycosyltransferase [Euryarchaeota archaeon]
MDISVIVPTLNEEENIEACLASIYSQETDLEYEVIVSDGGSEDRTVELARNFTDLIVVSDRRGTGIQRNEGATLASADHLLFLDADTLLLSDYLERAHRKFVEDPGLLAFSGSFIFPNRTPKLIFTEKVMNSYFRARSRLGRATLPGFNINIRKEVFERIGGFRDVPLEDIELSIKLRDAGTIRYFPDLYVITSSRRLEKMGLLGSIRYYIEMDLARREPFFRDALLYGGYFSCRVKGSDIQQIFEKAFTDIERERHLDFSVKEYIKQKLDLLPEIKSISPTGLLKDTLATSTSIADIGFRERIERIDADRAVAMIKEKIRALKEKTQIKNR